MAYGKGKKPLIVGLPTELKNGIGQIAIRNQIAEAEVIRRLCTYMLNNPTLLERAVHPEQDETKTYLEKRLYRGINCSPTQYLE
jgi:hypothetical protein